MENPCTAQRSHKSSMKGSSEKTVLYTEDLHMTAPHRNQGTHSESTGKTRGSGKDNELHNAHFLGGMLSYSYVKQNH